MTIVGLIAVLGVLLFILIIGGGGLIVMGLIWGVIFKALNISGPWDRWDL